MKPKGLRGGNWEELGNEEDYFALLLVPSHFIFLAHQKGSLERESLVAVDDLTAFLNLVLLF